MVDVKLTLKTDVLPDVTEVFGWNPNVGVTGSDCEKYVMDDGIMGVPDRSVLCIAVKSNDDIVNVLVVKVEICEILLITGDGPSSDTVSAVESETTSGFVGFGKIEKSDNEMLVKVIVWYCCMSDNTEDFTNVVEVNDEPDFSSV